MRARVVLLAAALALGSVVGCGEDSGNEDTTTATARDFEILGSWAGELRQKGLEPFRVTATIGDLDDPAAKPTA